MAEDVWIRPWLSVTGTRCTRWPPPSYLNAGHARLPDTSNGHAVEAAAIADVGSERLGSQRVAAGVGDVHLVEIAGEQVGLLASLCAADLDDDVAAGMGIGRNHQLRQLGGDLVQGLGGRRQLGREQLTIVADRLGEQFMGGLGIGAQRPLPAGCGDDRGQLVISLGHRAQLCRIGGDGRIGQACLEIGMLLLDRSKAVGKLIRHSFVVRRSQQGRSRLSRRTVTANLEL